MLSFAQDDPAVLGDIVISLPTAARQAEAAGWTLENEIALLGVHGLLHLLGYDDETEAGAWEMQARTEAALRQAGVPVPSAGTHPFFQIFQKGRLMGAIEERHSYSRLTLASLVESVSKIAALENSPLCLYATGSFGRLEACKHSDLDLLFFHPGTESDTPVSHIEKTLVDAALIKVCRDLSLPEFDGDGRFLGVHYLGDVKNLLGGPDDDYRNHFTARMLLLLESRWIYNEQQYDSIVQGVIASYFRDYDNHDLDFSPRFLVNDIMRFWKTLCLNYEHRRNRPEDFSKNKNHLANLKLKFSRLLTCFSTIAVLSTNLGVIKPEELFDLVHHAPLHRLRLAVKEEHPHFETASSHLSCAVELYDWFLDLTNRPKADMVEWISSKQNRDLAFQKGREFGDEVFDLLTVIADKNVMRYLVV